MNYTLNQLQIFLKIAQTGSVTKAAEELYLTQPAVSIQLKNFQDQFDVPLTEVVGRQIYITDFGKEIAEVAENILNQVNEINFKSLAHKGQLVGRLKISIVSTGKYVMPFFLAGFMKENPGVDLIMDVTNKRKVLKSLENNEVDFSLVSILPETIAVNKIDLLDNKLYLVGNKSVKNKSRISVSDLSGEIPLIFREQGSGTRQTMERFIEKNKIKVQKKMELTSNEAVKQAVLAGLGYSIMPLIGIKSEIKSGQLRIIPVKGLPIKTVWRMIWVKGKNLSPVANAFLKYVNEEKENIIHKYFNETEQGI